MTSNAYIATDGETVMKVGKANDVKRREREIAIPITFTVACLDEKAALRVESSLRDFVIEQGGIRHQGTIDWFKFDHSIYVMLCEFAQTVYQEFQEVDLDLEIAILVQRYHELIMKELKIQIADMDAQIELLSTEVQTERELAECSEKLWQQEIITLNKKIAVLEFQLEQLEGKDYANDK